jgi:tetratricopeptide (TPR) repeat protein
MGGCTLDGVEAVCDTRLDLGMDLVDGLSSLVDKNLIQRVDRTEAEPRFSMLETIREYASEKLRESGEQAITKRAHAAYFMVLAEEGNPKLSQMERSRWLCRCDREIDNYRLALDWLYETPDLEWSLRLCAALFRFWDMREHLSEGRSRLEAVLKLAGAGYQKERARISVFLGALTTSQGDGEAAERFLTQSLSLYEAVGDDSGIAASLNALAIAARDRGDYASAQSRFERSLACWRMLSDQAAVARCLHNLANVVKVRGDFARARWALCEATAIFEHVGDRNGAAWSVNQRGDVERAAGDHDEARRCYENALSIFRETGDPWGSARSLTDLGYMNCEQGREVEARAAFGEALAMFAALGHRRGIARTLEGCAYLASSGNEPARALRLASAAASIRRTIRAPLPEDDQAKVDQILRPARLSLSSKEAISAWAEGEAMSMEASIAEALQD